jgi:phospholipase C
MRTLFTCASALVALAACTDPQRSAWGLDAISTMQTPPDDPALGCGVVLPQSDAFGREHCDFVAGDPVQTTLGVTSDLVAQIPIRHIVVMMKENRSFDHLLGRLHDVSPQVDAIPSNYSNPDTTGMTVQMTHATTTCIPFDPGHQAVSMVTGIDNGNMDGFVLNAAHTTDSDGHWVMQYYTADDLPFYYFLASTFALNTRHFAPMASGTFADRNFLYFAQNAGAVDTGIVYADPSTPSIFQLLMNAGFTWGAYAPSGAEALSGTLDFTADSPGVHSIQDLYDAMDHGTLPNVAFIDGEENVDDDHPTADLQDGETWTKALYDHAIKSPQWKSMAMLWTYDEGGGFPDHVPPGVACASDRSSPFTQRGVRVPMVVISPWARRGYVSQVAEDHTAITRFIETVFNLPALTARDANSPALLDMFDFSCGRDQSVPAAPNPGMGGCAMQPPMQP